MAPASVHQIDARLGVLDQGPILDVSHDVSAGALVTDGGGDVLKGSLPK